MMGSPGSRSGPGAGGARLATLAEILPRGRALYGDRTAIVEQDWKLTYADLAERVERAAGDFAAGGVGAGDRVALLLANSTAFIVAHYALVALGAVVVPVNTQMKRELLRYALEKSRSRCVVTDAAHVDSLHEADVQSGGIREIWTVEGGPEEALTLRPSAGNGAERPVSRPLDGHRARPDDPAVLFLTSGTTGRPKGILLTHDQAIRGIHAWVTTWRFGPTTRSLMVAPYFHVVYHPLVLGAHYAGGSTVVLDHLTTRAAMAAVERHRVTAIMGNPAFFTQLLQDRTAQQHDTASLREIIYGAAPTPVAVVRALGERYPHCRRFNCYGLTETASALSCLTSEESEGREHSVGRAHTGVEISIRDSEGRVLPPGARGEVCCRGPNVIREYYDAPDVTAARFFGDWLRTGDVGYLDDSGYLYLLDRVDDLINVAGEKVYPCEVEEVLYRHPDVVDAAAVGVPHPTRGQVVQAFVTPRAGAHLDGRELRAFCRRHLPAYAVPRSIELTDRLPRNPGGKIVRSRLVGGSG